MSRDMPSRREVLKSTAIGLAAAATTPSRAAPTKAAQVKAATTPTTAPAEPVFYYVDGYHGGVDGHMPADSLRNVLDGLDRFPKWKVSFEIEPYSWAVFAKSDPASIERLRQLLKDTTPAARIEMVSAAFGQPYAWNASGECNIRHLLLGRRSGPSSVRRSWPCLATLSAMFSFWVPRKRSSGLMQVRTSQRWQTSKPSGMAPRFTAHDARCACQWRPLKLSPP